ncbi:MAG: GNAT family N-acetyltransferase [Bauldia sp.]
MAKPQTVRLLPLLPEDAAAVAKGEKAFAGKATDRVTAALIRMVAEETDPLYRFTTQKAPYLRYFVEDVSTGAVVGACGFKDSCRDGSVEITYFTFPQYENQGYGTAMARELVNLAFAQPAVQVLLAQTRTQQDTSTAILSTLKFEKTGTDEEADDGPAWNWRLTRAML